MFTDFNLAPIDVAEVIFVPAPINIPGVTAEYHITDNKLQVHLWSDKFPGNMEMLLRRSLAKFDSCGLIIDYVPEVNSWYVEISEMPVPPTEAYVEKLLASIG